MTSKSSKSYYTLTSSEFAVLLNLLFGDSSKAFMAKELGLARPTLNKYMKFGVTSKSAVLKLREYSGERVVFFRDKARDLDRWTTSF